MAMTIMIGCTCSAKCASRGQQTETGKAVIRSFVSREKNMKIVDEMKGWGPLTAMLLRQIEQSCEYDWEAPFAAFWAVMFLSLLCVFMLQKS